MRKFLFNFLTFAILTAFLLVFTFVLSLQIKRPENVILLNPYLLKSTNILVLGDSRADRQINPEILNQNLNLNCLNIAGSSLDLFSLSRRLVNRQVKSLIQPNHVIIISASSWQINDGSTDYGYFREEAFNQLNYIDKLYLYSDNIRELINMNKKLVSDNEINLEFGNLERNVNSGFRNCKCNQFDSIGMLTNHPWYRNINFKGVKRNLLTQALININTLNCRIIIYNGPVYAGFKTKAKNNGIWEMEDRFTDFMKETIINQKLENISFYDLRDLSGFVYGDYYDPQHFCESGANKFTKKIIEIFHLNNIN